MKRIVKMVYESWIHKIIQKYISVNRGEYEVAAASSYQRR